MTMNLIEPAIPGEKVTSVWRRSSRLVNCLFCDLLSKSSPLCSNCMVDPVQTRTAIYLNMHNLERQEQLAYECWSDLCTQHLPFWEKLIAGRAKSPDADARARQAHPTYALLLDAEAEYARAAQALRAERERLERALEALGEL